MKLTIAVVAALVSAFAPGAQAQTAPAADTCPARTVRVVVPFAPGGALDTVARLVSQKLGEKFNQPFVVENKPGAANIIGNDLVAKSPPDGCTLLFAAAPIALNQALGIKTPYDVQKDLTPISLVASGGVFVLVHPSTPYKTMQDIVEASKAAPGGLNYATAGVGSMPHLIGEGWRVKSGAKLVHVGYKGSAGALQDAVAGTVTVLLDGYIPSGAQVAAGKLRAIAYGAPQRSALLPNVPTTAEQGFPDLVGGGFFGLMAPAGTPKALIDKIAAGVKEVLAQPDVRERLIRQGYEVHGSTPAEYSAYIRREIERWTPVAKAAGIKPE
ncbi:MAG: tripartite tricarboxylate transporter substrate binding protein [Burkholderiaceae bacterium]|nr:tripartite tricarboxylate transporter substrate binding protein [Burkholderiaceae bacterium]